MSGKSGPLNSDHQAFADDVLWKALKAMQDHGVPFETIMDRLLTNAAAQLVRFQGAALTASTFRTLAGNIERGALTKVEHSRRSH